MTWQDPIVALIVGGAVVALYRHLRALVGTAAPQASSKASCHGCDDCADDPAQTPAIRAGTPPPPGSLRAR